MRDILRKEFKLSASPLAYLFIAFGLMFFLPGYPVLCGAFFTTLGLFQSFLYAREANDLVFSALLPIAKKDVVRGRYLFTCLIEIAAFVVMAIAAALRMTVFADSPVYRANALMNANLFALGMALVIFGLFNLIFVRGFFRTGYKLARPFVAYGIACFPAIGAAEAAHYIPGLGALNAFGTEDLSLELPALLLGALAYIALTVIGFRRSAALFEKLDL